jgi:hypothetical protein
MMAGAQDLEVGMASGQSLLQDEAYRLESRGVIALAGACSDGMLADVLQPMVCNSLAEVSSKPVLTHMVDDAGVIAADLFLVQHEDALLLECAAALLSEVSAALAAPAAALGVDVTDVSDQWRVFAELPDQTTFDDGLPCIKYTDPRWHMGARLLRPAAGPVSYRWGSELKWIGHAFKLGFLPGADLLRGMEDTVSLTVAEAGLHSLGLVDAARLPSALQDVVADPRERLARRLLPLRVEPNAFVFPTMSGQAVMAGQTVVATVIAHQGLYGLALVDLAPWRAALAAGETLHCAGQQVLLTWPSWLAQESQGRGGPVALGEPA